VREIDLKDLVKVASLSSGKAFGELALMSNDSLKKRTASIACDEDCQFGVLSDK
jgi:hypothetical protein